MLHDLHGLEAAAGERLASESRLETMIPTAFRRQLYLFALERGFLDTVIDRFVVEPFLTATRALARFDEVLCRNVAARTPFFVTDDAGDRDE